MTVFDQTFVELAFHLSISTKLNTDHKYSIQFGFLVHVQGVQRVQTSCKIILQKKVYIIILNVYAVSFNTP